jgi:hypothetical protein
MEIKQTVLQPFGTREESGSNGSLWSMAGKVIGSPEPLAGFVTADVTLTGVGILTTMHGSPIGWAFNKTGHTVAVGDWVRASGYYVIDETGNRVPDGPININGDWEIDSVNGNYFSSAALRTEIGDLYGTNASSFDSGPAILVLVDNK